MRRLILSFFAFAICCNLICAQNADSIRYLGLTKTYTQKTDSAGIVLRSRQFFSQVQTINTKRFHADAAGLIASRMYEFHKSSEAKTWLSLAGKIYKDEGLDSRLADLNAYIGKQLSRQYDFQTALPFLLNAVKGYERSNLPSKQATTLLTLSLSAHDFGSYDDGLEYAVMAKSVLDKNAPNINRNFYWYVYNDLGINYDDKGRQDSALISHYKALEYAGSASDSSYSFNNLGNSYKKLGKLDSAQTYFQKALETAKLDNDDYQLASVYNNLMDVETRKGNYATAMTLVQSGNLYARKSESPEKQIDFLFTAADLMRKTGRFQTADSLSTRYIQLKDSFFTAEKNAAVLKYQALFEMEQKNSTLAQIQVQLAQSALESKRKSTLLYVFGGLALLAVIIIWFSYKQLRLKKVSHELENKLIREQSRVQLQEQRLELSRELHDSLGGNLTFLKSLLAGNSEAGIAKEKVDAMTTLTESSILELRNTLWVLNNENLTVEDFRLKCLNFMRTAADANEHIQFGFESDIRENALLSSRQATNLFRVFQELITNAVRHAQASAVEIKMYAEMKKLEFSVADNGKGFVREDHAEGHGLRNIYARVSDLDGSIEMKSSPGDGTAVIVILSL